MIRPLTDDERRAWQLGTEDIATNPKGFVSVEVLAMNRQRYEATLHERDVDVAEYCLQLGAAKELLAQAQDMLQAKDTQIDRLVAAIRALMGWSPAEGHTRYDYDSDLEEIWDEATEAIKEATS